MKRQLFKKAKPSFIYYKRFGTLGLFEVSFEQLRSVEITLIKQYNTRISLESSFAVPSERTYH